MIVTVTMNPAIDKTVEIDHLEQGGLNRIRKTEVDVGGKGINVSKTIKKLGGESIATGFVGGNAGNTIEQYLAAEGIKTDFVHIQEESRTNMKIYQNSGALTELNEMGPVITESQLQELVEKIASYASADTLFVLAGSIPRGVPKEIYYNLIQMVHEKGASVLLDADGELFEKAIAAGPDIIKPNRVELEEYMGMDYRASDSELAFIAEKIITAGVKKVAISMGRSGAMFLEKDYRVKCPGLDVKAHSTVGAGDAMVAALSYAWEKRLTREETVKICMACSAGAVTTIGTKPPAREVVDELMLQVEMNEIGL